MDLELDPLLLDRKRKFRRRGIVVALVFLALAIVGWQWTLIRDNARAWRSSRLAAAAEESLARNELQNAFEKAQSAYYLKPDGLEAIRAVGHVLDAAGKPLEALAFWRNATNRPDATAADRQALAEDLLKTGAFPEAEKLISSLRAEQPKSAAILRLHSRLAAAQGRIADGLALVKESLGLDPKNVEGRFLEATILAQSGGETEGRAALNAFWDLTTDPGPIGFRALEVVAQWKDPPTDRAAELIRRLGERSAPDERLKLLALDVALRAQPDQSEQIIASAVSKYAGREAEVRRQVGVWLNAHGAFERTLDLLPEEESFMRKDLLLVHLDAIASLGRWSRVRQILEKRDVPLEEVYRQVFLARCAAQEADPTRSESHWRRARTEAGNDPARLWFVGDYAERSGELEQAELVYRALVRNATSGRAGYDALLRVVSRRKETSAVREVLLEMRKRFPQDTAVENDLAYFSLLLGTDLEEARASAENLRLSAPGNLAHRTTLALAYCRLDQPAAAVKAYEGMDVPWERVSPSQRAIHAAALGMNGDVESARAQIAGLPLDSLRVEERKLIEPWIGP